VESVKLIQDFTQNRKEGFYMRLFIIFLFLITFSQFQNVYAKENIKLVGKINNVEIVEEKDSMMFTFDATLTLTNTGKVPILLFLPETWLCINRDVYGIALNEASEKRLLLNGSLPSISNSKEWLERKEKLNAKVPPSNLFRKLESGESFIFGQKEWLSIGKEKAKSPVQTNFGDLSWNEIKNAKLLSIRLEYRIWSLNLETYSLSGNKRFGKKLQKRWGKYGYLWLDDIVSEPIGFDFNSVIVKTLGK
jgi:hypothetical protein